MSTPAVRAGTIEGLQILRAVAALMVVVYHARHSIPGGDAWPGFGEAGVDIFFVISGFVMAHTTRNLPAGMSAPERRTASLDFITKRLIRVVPLYWLVLLWTSRREILQGTAGTDLLKDFAFVPHPSTVYPDFLWPSVIQGWTLNYEMLFYGLFGAAILVGGLRWRLVVGTLVGLVAAGALLAAYGVPLRGVGWPGDLLRFCTYNIVLEFGFGVLLQVATASGLAAVASRRHSFALLAAGFALLLLGHGLAPRGLAQGLPALLIVWGSLGAFAGVRSPAWERLGAASYAIYLVHWASFAAAKPIAAWLGPAAAQPLGSVVLLASLVFVAVVSGLLVHTWVEKPFLRWAQARMAGGAPRPVVAVE